MKVLSNSIRGAWGIAGLLFALAIVSCSSEDRNPARSVQEKGFIGPILVEPEPELEPEPEPEIPKILKRWPTTPISRIR